MGVLLWEALELFRVGGALRPGFSLEITDSGGLPWLQIHEIQSW